MVVGPKKRQKINSVHFDSAVTQPQQKPLPFPPRKDQTLVPQSSYSKVCRAPLAISAKSINMINHGKIFMSSKLGFRKFPCIKILACKEISNRTKN